MKPSLAAHRFSPRLSRPRHAIVTGALALGAWLAAPSATAAPVVSRLTPPSALFTFHDSEGPYIARFLPGQRFDLQATVQPDDQRTIAEVQFYVDGVAVARPVAMTPATVRGLPTNTVVATRRAFSSTRPGVHLLEARARQSDGQTVQVKGNFEIVPLAESGGRVRGPRAKNLIILLGDGMGIAHRTAARIMWRGVQMGKATSPLAMDTFPFTALVMTPSLNSIVTDSAPGMSSYATGNKGNNGEEGVFPDDTRDKFDNPRIELLGEYLHRTQGRALGIVTTADVFDATPAAMGVHTQDRGAGTGICDQYLDETVQTSGLRVLMGGGRKWFLPRTARGSQRRRTNDYVLPEDLASGWGVPRGALDPRRNLLADFVAAGFAYAPDRAALATLPASTERLLGLFAFSNMNVAKDKIDKRRHPHARGVVDDYGFPDQPMLDEMAARALDILGQSPNGFTLLVEGASIDKQSHEMDSDRWILEVIEFDRAVAVCQKFAREHRDTLVVVTADHETGGAGIIGASRVSDAELRTRSLSAEGAAAVRDPVVGTYEQAGFPVYQIAADGYPLSTDPDHKLLIGYAAGADRHEDWRTDPLPLRDTGQPFHKKPPLNSYPAEPLDRDVAGGYLVTGQVPGTTAVHTASDIPLSAFGFGASQFTGVMDNTDVFFKMMRAATGGVKN